MGDNVSEHINAARSYIDFLEGLAAEYPDAKQHILADGSKGFFTARGKATDVEFVVGDKDRAIYAYPYFEFRDTRVYVSSAINWSRGVSHWALMRDLKKHSPKSYADIVEAAERLTT